MTTCKPAIRKSMRPVTYAREKKFPHIEAAAADLIVHNALFWGREKLNALAIPWCTYTDPEIAHVGLYVKEARAKGIPVKTFTVMMSDVDRAITDGEDEGFVKIHVKEGTDKILGATVAASHAGEMISEMSLAINAGIGLGALARVNHPYPTQAQAIKMAADAYRATRHTPHPQMAIQAMAVALNPSPSLPKTSSGVVCAHPKAKPCDVKLAV